MTENLAEQLILYQSNVIPAMLAKLSQQLKVSMNSLTALGIGYALRVPLKKGKEVRDCWVFPERDENGEVIGLMLRGWDGKKLMVPGSKRGLIYVSTQSKDIENSSRYVPGPQNWTRTDSDIACPVCGKTNACLVSSDKPNDPKAVLCCRTSTGSVKSFGDFHLHILRSEGNISIAKSIIATSDYPILITEGASDVAAAMDIGFVAIGRSNSTGGLDKLTSLVAGRDIIVLGENDAGAGREGMEKTFEVLQPHAKSAIKLMPPNGIKDLRQWVTRGLTRIQLYKLTRTVGESTDPGKILISIAPMDLAKLWLDTSYRQHETYTLRVFHGDWYRYNQLGYTEIERAELRKQLYQFFGDKQYKKIRANGFDILNYEPTKYKIDQIIDALLAFCPITAEEIPCWLNRKYITINPKHVLVFPNGWINIDGYMRGTIKLRELTPHFFTLAGYPYEFNPKATCGVWDRFLREIFDDDSRKIDLLQEWFGYNLIPDNSYEKFMMLLGPVRAGKGTILDMLSYILGESQVIATSFRDYTRRFGIYPFLGKLAAVMGDVSVKSNYDATEALNILKRITGNDAMMVERKGRDITQTHIKLYTRFSMAANIMPDLPDFSRAIESRVLILKLQKSFAGREDTTLKRRLRVEAPGVLLWALEGLQRLQENKEFTLPLEHEQEMQRIRGDITPFVEFIDEYCELGDGPEYFTLHDYLYEGWKQWAIKNGEKLQTVRWIKRSLLSLFPNCTSKRQLFRGQRRRGFCGIKFRDSVAANILGE